MRPIQVPSTAKIGALFILAGSLGACGPHAAAPSVGSPDVAPASESAYRPPPRVAAARREAGGAVVLTGAADPKASVRLTEPSGAVTPTSVDAGGLWRAVLAPATGMRLLGLSMSEGGRRLQAEGYLAVTPGGQAAQLRAGAGALVISQGAGRPEILAVDFDRQGGAVVSGAAPAGARVDLSVDDRPRGETRAGPAGRFSLALGEPLAPGAHRLTLERNGQGRGADIVVSPAAAMPGPYRAQQIGGGWRIDWLTPGGGIQTTLIMPPPGVPG